MTSNDAQGRNLSAADRIARARDRERALGSEPPRVRSSAAARDRLLATLAATDGWRPATRALIGSVGIRHPRAGDALRALAARVLRRYGARGGD